MKIQEIGWVLTGALAACGGVESREWAGTIDTLPGGRVLVTNPAEGVWGGDARWEVVEDLRIGSADGEGPELFGRLGMLAEDAGGRIWVFESVEQQFKVFDADGRFIRTVGRRGGGPGEMQRATGIVQMPDGRLLVVDMAGARISVFDTAGSYLAGHPITGGFTLIPWPGGVDRNGYFYNAVPRIVDDEFTVALVRYDSALTPLDTLFPPQWESQEYFEHRNGDNIARASVPYTSSLTWRLTRDGDFWSLLTGPYELVRQRGSGDTLRVVTKPFASVAVSGEEKDTAVARLKWFTDEGGTVDRGRIPNQKPAALGFLVAEDGHLWVSATTADTSDVNRVFDIFDPEGRYLGDVRLPFPMLPRPAPLVSADRLIAVTEDADGVPYVVRARIVKSAPGADGRRP
ncbi:MAG: 6-bladed beta-propeller [Gemmatimonadales bacterium]